MVINKKIKMLTLLFAALLIVPVAFSACGIVTGSQSAGTEDTSNVTQAPEGTADEETDDTSDHYPVIADLKFN